MRLTRIGQQDRGGGGMRQLQLFSPGLAVQRRALARAAMAAARSAAVMDLGCGEGTLLCGALEIASSLLSLEPTPGCAGPAARRAPKSIDGPAGVLSRSSSPFAPLSEAIADPKISLSAVVGVDIVDASLVRACTLPPLLGPCSHGAALVCVPAGAHRCAA